MTYKICVVHGAFIISGTEYVEVQEDFEANNFSRMFMYSSCLMFLQVVACKKTKIDALILHSLQFDLWSVIYISPQYNVQILVDVIVFDYHIGYVFSQAHDWA